jgi:hypothetical protein
MPANDHTARVPRRLALVAGLLLLPAVLAFSASAEHTGPTVRTSADAPCASCWSDNPGSASSAAAATALV